MALKFRIRDFFSPLSLIEKRFILSQFEFSKKEQIEKFQINQLIRIIEHSKKHSNFYRERLKNINAKQLKEDINLFREIPILTKDDIRKNQFKLMTSSNTSSLSQVSTSGSSGEPLSLFMDNSANSLEFNFYLRFWGWHGYKLFNRFAEFSAYSFIGSSKEFILNKLTNRLILNSLQISEQRVKSQYDLLKSFKPLFIKGSPSTIITFINFAKYLKLKNIHLKAIFTSGEILTPKTRQDIQDYFECKVFDTYGHMERTFAACECEHQNLHLNLDYGFTEFIKTEQKNIYSLLSTGLHNFAMPLIRYEIGDLIEYDPNNQSCKCNRPFPLIMRILGRETSVIRLPSNKIITALYLIFDDLPEISIGQIIQEDLYNLTIKIIPNISWNDNSYQNVLNYIRKYVGNEINIDICLVENRSELLTSTGKFSTVISKM